VGSGTRSYICMYVNVLQPLLCDSHLKHLGSRTKKYD